MNERLTPKRFLHVGCGGARKDRTTAWLASEEWEEVRLDIDPDCRPDIVGSIVDLAPVDERSFDALYSSHCIEHLMPHEVPRALASFCRVLKPEGHLVLSCPDLQAVCAHIAQGRLLETLYQSPAGPIAPLDILYGHRASLARGQIHMAHRCGFVAKVLGAELHGSGFGTIWLRRVPDAFALTAVASKNAVSEEDILALAGRHFPGLV